MMNIPMPVNLKIPYGMNQQQAEEFSKIPVPSTPYSPKIKTPQQNVIESFASRYKPPEQTVESFPSNAFQNANTDALKDAFGGLYNYGQPVMVNGQIMSPNSPGYLEYKSQEAQLLKNMTPEEKADYFNRIGDPDMAQQVLQEAEQNNQKLLGLGVKTGLVSGIQRGTTPQEVIDASGWTTGNEPLEPGVDYPEYLDNPYWSSQSEYYDDLLRQLQERTW